MNKVVKPVGAVVGVVVLVGIGTFGTIIYRQLHPALPADLAALGDIALTNATGRPAPLRAATTPNSATIVAFWATWCVPCRSEATELAALRKEYGARDLAIVYLNVDEVPNARATASFIHATHADNLPVLYAGRAGWQAVTGSASMALPRSYVFDRHGRATAAFTGFEADTRGTLTASVATAIAG